MYSGCCHSSSHLCICGFAPSRLLNTPLNASPLPAAASRTSSTDAIKESSRARYAFAAGLRSGGHTLARFSRKRRNASTYDAAIPAVSYQART
jgi:hypothetical protein